MRVKKQSTMTWEEAPDTVGVEDVMKILGIGKNKAFDMFNEKDFPRIKGTTTPRADKEMARLYIQGFKVKENPKVTIDYMILAELKKLNELMEKNLIANER